MNFRFVFIFQKWASNIILIYDLLAIPSVRFVLKTFLKKTIIKRHK